MRVGGRIRVPAAWDHTVSRREWSLEPRVEERLNRARQDRTYGLAIWARRPVRGNSGGPLLHPLTP